MKAQFKSFSFLGLGKIFVCSFSFFILTGFVFSQEDPVRRKGFTAGVSYVNVKDTRWGLSDYSYGIFGEYEHPIIKKIGLIGVATAGVDFMQNINPVETSWYHRAYWWGFGLKRTFVVEKQVFSIQARYRWFGFNRQVPTSQDPVTGEFINWMTGKSIKAVWGIRIGYMIPIKLPLELSYSHEPNPLHRINTVGLAWQF